MKITLHETIFAGMPEKLRWVILRKVKPNSQFSKMQINFMKVVEV